MNNNLNDIKELIEKNKSFTNQDMDLFTNIFANLLEKQEKLYQNLENIVKEDVFITQHIDTKIYVTCDLNDEDRKDELKEQFYFNPIINLDKNKIVFIDCNYEQIESYLSKEFNVILTLKDNTKQTKKCKLYKYYGYIDAEKILANTFNQNKVRCPYIYSPLSRKAFEIVFEDEVDYDAITDIEFEDENIKTNLTLYWNVNIEESDTLPSLNKVMPQNDNVYQIVSFKLQDNEYIYIKNQNCDIKRLSNKAYINIDKKNYDINEIDYCKIQVLQPITMSLNKLKENNNKTFQNFYDNDLDIKTRIITKADLEYTLNQFSYFELKLTSISTALGNRKTIKVYDKDDKYVYTKNPIFSNSVLYINFEKNNDIYFNDTISYIIAYLNYYYPEYMYIATV